MKRILIAALTIIAFSTSSFADSSKDFRNTTWGMNAAKVLASEGKKPAFKNKDGQLEYIGYPDKIAGFDCIVLYALAYNKLVRSSYGINSQHTNKNDYIADYNKLKGALSNKYGTPDDDETFWFNDLYKSDPTDWGMAVAVGHMAMSSKWETPTTIISVRLTGDNYKISLRATYESKELTGLLDKAKEEQEASKL